MVSPNATWWLPGDRPGGELRTREQMRSTFKALYARIKTPPIFEFTRTTAESDRVCVEMTARGGLVQDGIPYANDFIWLIRFDGDLIIEVREFLNPNLSTQRQATRTPS
jgi:ketosteroid isomerase-like protein